MMTTPTPRPTTPDILKEISSFLMKIILDSTYQAHAMEGDYRKCGICQHDPQYGNMCLFSAILTVQKSLLRGVREGHDPYESC